jgi:hypothetical protein
MICRRQIAGVGMSVWMVIAMQLSAAAQAGQPSVNGSCLTPAQQAVNDKYNALTRPTSRDDDMPFFDPDYFAGTWDYISRSVDSVFGQGGESAGTLAVSKVKGCSYAGEIKGEDPNGKAYTRKVRLDYDTNKKHLVWTDVDSRGYTIVMPGPVGGELGGLFHHHFEGGAPTVVGGKKVQFKGVTEMSSPAYFKTDFKVSVDGGPETSFGRATFEKRVGGK